MNRYILSANLETDIIYLQKQNVSSVAITIAVMLFSDNEKKTVDTLLRIAEDMDKIRNYEIETQLLNRCLEYDSSNQRALELLKRVNKV
jgi:hypothetical protein